MDTVFQSLFRLLQFVSPFDQKLLYANGRARLQQKIADDSVTITIHFVQI